MAYQISKKSRIGFYVNSLAILTFVNDFAQIFKQRFATFSSTIAFINFVATSSSPNCPKMGITRTRLR